MKSSREEISLEELTTNALFDFIEDIPSGSINEIYESIFFSG